MDKAFVSLHSVANLEYFRSIIIPALSSKLKMKGISSFTLSCGFFLATLMSVPVYGIARTLSEGWNLVSIPVSGPVEISTFLQNQELSDKVRRIWTFEDRFWQSYKPGEESSLELLEPGRGYWFLMSSSAVLDLTSSGTLLSSLSSDQPGWILGSFNQISDLRISTEVLIPQNIKGAHVAGNVKKIWEYSRGWASYTSSGKSNTLSVIQPGFAYWFLIDNLPANPIPPSFSLSPGSESPTEEESQPPPNVLPQVQEVSTVGQRSNLVVQFSLVDPDSSHSGKLGVELHYSTDGLVWETATVTGNTNHLLPGLQTLIWNSSVDFSNHETNVFLRLAPYDPVGNGVEVHSDPFSVYNGPNPLLLFSENSYLVDLDSLANARIKIVGNISALQVIGFSIHYDEESVELDQFSPLGVFSSAIPFLRLEPGRVKVAGILLGSSLSGTDLDLFQFQKRPIKAGISKLKLSIDAVRNASNDSLPLITGTPSILEIQ